MLIVAPSNTLCYCNIVISRAAIRNSVVVAEKLVRLSENINSKNHTSIYTDPNGYSSHNHMHGVMNMYQYMPTGIVQ